MESTFVLRERTAAQSVSVQLTRAVTELPRVALGDSDSSRAGTRQRQVPLLIEIAAVAERIVNLGVGRSAAVTEVQEAAEKAKVWAIVGTIVALVVTIIVAIVVAVFSFGAGAPAAMALTAGSVTGSTSRVIATARAALMNALLAAIQALIGIAQFAFDARSLGHPLAGRFGAAMEQIAAAARSATSGDAVALEAALRTILQSLLQVERLTVEARSLPGPCLGDPTAITQSARDAGLLLARLVDVLQTMRILHDADAQAVVRVLTIATASLATLPPIVARR